MPATSARIIVLSAIFLFITSLKSQPASALDLLSAGWSFSPASPGACPTPGTDFDCYENRTASDISIIGSDSSSGSNTTAFGYSLTSGDSAYQTSFDYSYSDGSVASIAYYQLGSNPPSLLSGAGSIPPFRWNPGESLVFSVSQNGFNAYAGQLAITSFLSTSMTPAPTTESVPAPLPAVGAIAAFMRSRMLRRRFYSDQVQNTRHR